MPDIPSATAFQDHDHTVCAADALASAQAVCAAKGARLTPVRRRALEILLEEHRALGAYDVLERLSKDGFGTQPPVAYRALDFLVEHGLAHRIRRLNAFVACGHPGDDHVPLFLICTGCDTVAEAPGADMRAAMDQAADTIGFAIERANIEAIGLCPTCRESTT